MSILYIALNNLQLRFKEKKAIVWFIALPLVFTLITGMATSSGSSSSTGSIPVAVLDEDDSLYSRYIIEAIENDEDFYIQYKEKEEGERLVRENHVAGFIHIPSGFENGIDEKEKTDIYYWPAARQVSPLKVEKIIAKSISELNNSLAVSGVLLEVFSPVSDYNDLAQQALAGFDHIPVEVNFRWSDKEQGETLLIPTGMNQSSPGMAIMFTLMTVVMSGAATILLQKEKGTLARLLTTPNDKWTIIAGNTVAIYLLGLLQMLAMIIIGQLFLGVNWGNDILATLLLTFTFVFAATGIGMTLAAVSKNANQVTVVGNMIILVISMLGGAYWPIDLMSPKMQFISKLVPTSWAIRGYTDIIVRGMSLGDVWQNIFVLTLFGFLLIGFGIYRLKLE
ncbi:ABC transporter permease [Alkalicella caledoniensis]|uniref:ABC transporter permease n=1 Tax=Alkalicella caledoniensis TaxID=2731377 RepID=A0A7G9W761_ALKCA|nr:ABC transporter permease [Alkalicella caledoniensis]QNO14523.1 ABC transporter permease [Alkalicella caledoniensis]